MWVEFIEYVHGERSQRVGPVLETKEEDGIWYWVDLGEDSGWVSNASCYVMGKDEVITWKLKQNGVEK